VVLGVVLGMDARLVLEVWEMSSCRSWGCAGDGLVMEVGFLRVEGWCWR